MIIHSISMSFSSPSVGRLCAISYLYSSRLVLVARHQLVDHGLHRKTEHGLSKLQEEEDQGGPPASLPLLAPCPPSKSQQHA